MAKKVDTLDVETMKIVHSDEYNVYLKALCRLASEYVSSIRVKFAERALEKYADPTIRKLVLEYGKEAEKLDADRMRDFSYVAKYGATTPESLKDFCLNNTRAYGKAIWFLFGIDDEEDKKDGKND